MFATNPFSILAETVPSIVMQGFVVLMVLLIVTGTLLDIIHKKNVKYFFENAKKAKKNATKELSTSERIAVVSKTIAYDIGTTSELGAGKRRIAILLFPAPSSDVVPISYAIVFETTAILSLVDNSLVAFFFAFFAFSKKYLTFFLWIMSKRVPVTINKTINTTKPCITIDGTVSARIEKGFVANIFNTLVK